MSEASASITCSTLPPLAAPGQVTNVECPVTGVDNIRLAWTDGVSNGGSAVTGYRV